MVTEETTISSGDSMNLQLTTPARTDDLDLACTKIRDDFEDCPELLTTISELFRTNYPLDLLTLRAALTSRENAKVAFLAHKIRGSVLCFHQDNAANIATMLEEKAQRNDLNDTESLMESLTKTYDHVCISLERAEQLLVGCAAKND